jgi:hypothetical protein
MFIIEDNTQDYGGMNFIGRSRRRRSRRRNVIRRKKGHKIDKRQKTKDKHDSSKNNFGVVSISDIDNQMCFLKSNTRELLLRTQP